MWYVPFVGKSQIVLDCGTYLYIIGIVVKQHRTPERIIRGPTPAGISREDATMITLTNDFHNTEYNLRANLGDELSPSQIRRSRKALCGVSGCTCGGPLGERGDTHYGEEIGYAPDGAVRIVVR